MIKIHSEQHLFGDMTEGRIQDFAKGGWGGGGVGGSCLEGFHNISFLVWLLGR